jgi:polyisoprenoid-binding protein YceI
MKRWSHILLALTGLLLAATAAAEWKPIKLDTVHSRIGFTASTLLFDVDGRFGKYELHLDGDPAKPTDAKIKLVINAASIDTDNAKRDEHLSSADFLDAKKYPQITLVSESISQSGSTLNVTGTLDMHGRKKKLSIPFKVVKGKNGAGVDTTAFKGKLSINRNDFGVGAGSVAAKISLEDEVALDLLIVSFI